MTNQVNTAVEVDTDPKASRFGKANGGLNYCYKLLRRLGLTAKLGAIVLVLALTATPFTGMTKAAVLVCFLGSFVVVMLGVIVLFVKLRYALFYVILPALLIAGGAVGLYLSYVY